jgi:hypothetical protein
VYSKKPQHGEITATEVEVILRQTVNRIFVFVFFVWVALPGERSDRSFTAVSCRAISLGYKSHSSWDNILHSYLMLRSLFDAFYDLQAYGESILIRFHTGWVHFPKYSCIKLLGKDHRDYTS